MQWTQFLETGFPEIDSQHKELFSVANNFVSAIIEEREKDEIARVFKFLEDYIVFHFSNEEKLLAEKGYPDLEKHVLQHNYFKRHFEALKAAYEVGGVTPELVSGVHKHVVGWLALHIANTDISWANYLKSRPASPQT